mgnify:CR=1 FL=1
MKINQLFKTTIDVEVVVQLLQCFGLNGFCDDRFFAVSQANVSKIREMADVLQTYYIPCKARLYLSNLDKKRAVTLLKQALRLYGYTLVSKERSVQGKKWTVYQLSNKDNPCTMKRHQVPIVISFN